MKLTLRHEWRPRPFRSFVGLLDLKIGVQLALYFALFNKVAGVYGLIALFTGGSLAQLSLYIYSVCGLFAYIWGLKAVSEENAEKATLTAHIYLLDHLVSTLWTAFFGVSWWMYTPHDGKRVINSDAQVELSTGGAAAGHHPAAISDAQRAISALQLWNKEKAFAAALIIGGWLIKVYLCVLLYSYSYHLRHNSYRSLPLSQPNKRANRLSPTAENDLDDGDLYRSSALTGLSTGPMSAEPSSSRHAPMLSGASFTEFVGPHKDRTNGWPSHYDENDDADFHSIPPQSARRPITP